MLSFIFSHNLLNERKIEGGVSVRILNNWIYYQDTIYMHFVFVAIAICFVQTSNQMDLTFESKF